MSGWSVIRSHFYYCPPGWRHDLTFPDWDLWTLLTGSCILRRTEGDLPLVAGDSLCLPPGVRHRIDPVPGTAVRICAIHCQAPAGDPPPFQRRFADIPFAVGLMRRIVRTRLGCDDFLAALLAERTRQAEAPSDAWWLRLEELCSAILERPQDSYAIADLARRFGCSPAHMSRRFHAHAGSPVSEYVIASRLERARTLLVETPLPVREIAGQCGYTSVQFFTRQFHQRCGSTPANFRRERSPPAPTRR